MKKLTKKKLTKKSSFLSSTQNLLYPTKQKHKKKDKEAFKPVLK